LFGTHTCKPRGSVIVVIVTTRTQTADLARDVLARRVRVHLLHRLLLQRALLDRPLLALPVDLKVIAYLY
jgi:hypothetical protein